MTPSNLPDGVSLIECSVGETPNHLPLIWGERPVLIDTGLKCEPETAIVPAIRALGRDPADIRILLLSHADVDHTGGNAAMLIHCPRARIACSEQDRPLVESPRALWDARWNQLEADHGIAHPESERQMLGPGTHVDWVLRDGDTLALGDGRTLETVATPGHSHGHLSFLLHPDRILLAGDAIQGRGVPSGSGVTPPCYLDPEVYLATLDRIAGLALDRLLTCHWDHYRGDQIDALLKTSRAFVEEADALVCDLLARNRRGLTLKELTAHASRAIGKWNEPDDIHFAATVHGHVRRAVRQFKAQQIGAEPPCRFGGV